MVSVVLKRHSAGHAATSRPKCISQGAARLWRCGPQYWLSSPTEGLRPFAAKGRSRASNTGKSCARHLYGERLMVILILFLMPAFFLKTCCTRVYSICVNNSLLCDMQHPALLCKLEGKLKVKNLAIACTWSACTSFPRKTYEKVEHYRIWYALHAYK